MIAEDNAICCGPVVRRKDSRTIDHTLPSDSTSARCGNCLANPEKKDEVQYEQSGRVALSQNKADCKKHHRQEEHTTHNRHRSTIQG